MTQCGRRFEVFMAVKVWLVVLRIATQCTRVVGYWFFREIFCLYIRDRIEDEAAVPLKHR
jgi:hypothetical protein